MKIFSKVTFILSVIFLLWGLLAKLFSLWSFNTAPRTFIALSMMFVVHAIYGAIASKCNCNTHHDECCEPKKDGGCCTETKKEE